MKNITAWTVVFSSLTRATARRRSSEAHAKSVGIDALAGVVLGVLKVLPQAPKAIGELVGV